ncbi:unnamed protein product [Adineta ricciae]|uniref:Sacsin/Nov domain-containing protein n=1 Tax=Adineta ricciae TaxID=249248 RepID=A0A814ATA0_ADIRI|nr:unnamed protein product [Adineta ricciae]
MKNSRRKRKRQFASVPSQQESPKTTNPIPHSPLPSISDEKQYAKMRVISSPVFQLRDIIHALLTSSSYDLISTFLTYGQLLGASSIHGYLVDPTNDTQLLINDDHTSSQGIALYVTYDMKLSDQQWKDQFGIHESTSTKSKNPTTFFPLTDYLCILSGSRVIFYDPNERIINEDRAFVSIFDLETDDVTAFKDQFSKLDYFLFKSKTYYNGTLIRLPLRTILTQKQTLNDLKQQIYKYFNLNNSLIDLLLMQLNLSTIDFDYTRDFEIFQRFLSYEKHSISSIHDNQSTTQIIHLTLSRLINEINTSDVSCWLLSTHTNQSDIGKSKTELKLLLPLTPLSLASESHNSSAQSYKYQLIQITSSRTLYCHSTASVNLSAKDDLSTHLRQMNFPQAYALFLKDLSRLIKPTITSPSNLSIDLIWELMPDIDEHQRLWNDKHQYTSQSQPQVHLINKIIPDMWKEIGKQELFYSVTDGWGYVAIEDMIINNVEAGPIQDVLTFVFSEANAPIVILPSHVINGLCRYSNKQYLQVMTPFHASELLAKNSSLLLRLSFQQKVSLLKYIILNDPDPSLVLELELLPLANHTFATFQTKQAITVYVMDRNLNFLKLFHKEQHDRFLNPMIDQDLFDKLSSKNFQATAQQLQFEILLDRCWLTATIRNDFFQRSAFVVEARTSLQRTIIYSILTFEFNLER